ncbi:ferritin family protein [Pseudothauera rhizosphaerae]|uniref:Phenol hydroxylase n=1 Tax=Pseudothauera rhizosphaerae TaxID=2565932 RepID=A0A4S4ALH7_9RHOO|nr:phenol hydroxylase [Pseudothauera rhizosphaerae]THF60375.1 phenol hydroxylase [Pseudothauera rhizosphaerae]
MQIDLRTVEIKPLRQTFDHLAERFGDKPATRYQEGTYDIQQTWLYHYRPTWEPDLEIFDERRTRIRMKDWYDFKDPRQYYYGAYTIARAKQQEAADSAFAFAVENGMVEALPERSRELMLQFLVPARHAEWGANMNNMFMSAYGYGTAFEAACNYAAMDRLGIAQQISRIGLALGGEEALHAAKELWLRGASWQPLRRYLEDSFVVKDWFELFVAQNLVLDGLLYPFLYRHLRTLISADGNAFHGLATKFMSDWDSEATRWVDAIVKTAVAESAENKLLVSEWAFDYFGRGTEALAALAVAAFGSDAEAVVGVITDELKARLQKLGIWEGE